MTHYDLVASNRTRSWLVIFGFTVFVSFVAFVLASAMGWNGSEVLLAVLVSLVVPFMSYWFGDSIVLASAGAQPADRKSHFHFYTVTENLCMSKQLPMPRLFVIDDTSMNAFTTGRDAKHAIVCATTGLLDRLKRHELEAVIAHELAHIEGGDTRLMMIVAVMVGSVALLADWFLRAMRWGSGDRRSSKNSDSGIGILFFVLAIVLAILTPLISQLIQLALSRRREFLADAEAAAAVKNPRAMISALQHISQDTEPLEAANRATAHLFFISPVMAAHEQHEQNDGPGWAKQWFATHPPIADRVQALEQLMSGKP